MGAYDSRPVTLDPGLTALALRGLREHDSQYPFLDPFKRRRRFASAVGAWWLRAVSWLLPRRRVTA